MWSGSRSLKLPSDAFKYFQHIFWSQSFEVSMLSGGSLDKSHTRSIYLKELYVSVNILVSSCSAEPQGDTSLAFTEDFLMLLFGYYTALKWVIWASKFLVYACI